MVTRMNIYGATDVGRVRTNNEDCYIALVGDECPAGIDALLIVADGMGGHAAGEVASKMAVEGMVDKLVGEEDYLTSLEGAGFGAAIGKILEEVSGEVYVAGQFPPNQGMGTTCTVAAIKSSQLYLAHIGDSRAYLFRDGDLHQLTTDHTWVEEAVVSGILTRDAARFHPNRSVITRAVGLDPEVEADKQMMPLMGGDLLLLCSDGLNSMVTDADITDLLSSNVPEQVCAALIDVARGAGGHDNVTVVVAAS